MKHLSRYGAVAVLGCLLSAFILGAADVPAENTRKTPNSFLIWFGAQYGSLTIDDGPFLVGREYSFRYQSRKLPEGTKFVQLVAETVAGPDGKQPVLAQSEKKTLDADGGADFLLTIPERKRFTYLQFGIFFYDADGKRIENVLFQTQSRYPAKRKQLLEDLPIQSDFFRDSDGKMLWQVDQAKVNPAGDLAWTPRAPEEHIGADVRYIDYESGDDAADGKTPKSAWKHHPFDPEATAAAAADRVADTYLFKRGVIYRGILSGSRGGKPGAPLRLTSSASYGSGKAILLNSAAVKGPWQKTDIPGVWKTSVGSCEGAPVVHLRRGESMKRLWNARFPNFTYDDPDDARSGWLVMESVSREGKGPWRIQNEMLKKLPEGLDLSTLRARTDWNGVMGFPVNSKVVELDREKGVLKVRVGFNTTRDCRFFLFNDLKLLDEPGEFYYDAAKGDLYVMPEQEDDLGHLEFSSRKNGVTLEYSDHIEVSNLTFMGGCDQPDLFTCWNLGYERASAFRILDCDDVTIANCEFYNVPAGVFGTSPAFGISDRFTVRDSDFYDCGTWAIRFGEGAIFQAKLLRNRIRRTGYVGSSTMTCWLDPVFLGVIAGNILEDCGGNGIDCSWGGHGPAPLIRGMMFQNRVERSLRMINDYGNIESWQYGPVYIYNNLSVNPGGIWYPQIRNGGSPHFGFAYYLDGGFKNYLFNNIAKGVCNDRKSVASNNGAFQEIFGFNNHYFNNTIHKFESAFRRQMPEGGRNLYVGNLMDDISYEFYQLDGWRQNMTGAAERIEFFSNHYKDNLHVGKPEVFGRLLNRPVLATATDWAAALKEKKTQSAAFGPLVETSPLRDPEKLDFRLKRSNGVGGVAFAPLSLYACVGEWNFIQPDEGADAVVVDESFYPSREFTGRNMYQIVPRADLRLHNVAPADFVPGRCETWKNGAVRFNGKDQFAECTQAEMLRSLPKRQFDGKNRNTFDMKDNSFVIEAVATNGEGTLLSKHDGKTGYRVSMKGGVVALEILSDGGRYTATAKSAATAPDAFRHWLIEFDRGDKTVRFYEEGRPVVATISGQFPAGSLSNAGDFLVGKDLNGDFFAGAVDFLRLSQGTLRQSRTTAEEVFEWAFNGPNRRDFAGNSRGSRSDAGALQYTGDEQSKK